MTFDNVKVGEGTQGDNVWRPYQDYLKAMHSAAALAQHLDVYEAEHERTTGEGEKVCDRSPELVGNSRHQGLHASSVVPERYSSGSVVDWVGGVAVRHTRKKRTASQRG